jgi:glycosyltransferase involved in cell wall biosynthesis
MDPASQRPRFSIVIPTRDRPELLRSAIATITKQEYSDWEIIVSDNASQADLRECVGQFRDPRIRYVRTPSFLAVADSWEFAVKNADGEYWILIGDDDGLAPGALTKLDELLTKHDNPEIAYWSYYLFRQPDVVDNLDQGDAYKVIYASFLDTTDQPRLLSRAEALKAVAGSLALRRQFMFNMQVFAVRRDFIPGILGTRPLFRSPYPDYFAANFILAKAQTILVTQDALSIIGVTSRSIGSTIFNRQEGKEALLLNADYRRDPLFPSVEPFLLPGPQYNQHYILSMAHLVEALGGEPRQKVDFQRYREIQILSGIENDAIKLSEIISLFWPRLRTSEKLWTLARLALFRLLPDWKPVRKWRRRVRKGIEAHTHKPTMQRLPSGGFRTALDLYEALAQRREQ